MIPFTGHRLLDREQKFPYKMRHLIMFKAIGQVRYCSFFVMAK